MVVGPAPAVTSSPVHAVQSCCTYPVTTGRQPLNRTSHSARIIMLLKKQVLGRSLDTSPFQPIKRLKVSIRGKTIYNVEPLHTFKTHLSVPTSVRWAQTALRHLFPLNYLYPYNNNNKDLDPTPIAHPRNATTQNNLTAAMRRCVMPADCFSHYISATGRQPTEHTNIDAKHPTTNEHTVRQTNYIIYNHTRHTQLLSQTQFNKHCYYWNGSNKQK